MVARSTNCMRYSNLQSFIDCTAPTVQSFSIPKEYAQDVNSKWQPADNDKVVYFNLADLWEQYREWSAYGAGVPIRLQDQEFVVQYYIPYLSAIQIYTTKSLLSISTSKTIESSSESDSWSEDNNFQNGESEVTGSDSEGSWLTSQHIGHQYFQFSDWQSPYERLPLTDKVYEFAEIYPGLTNFRSADLSPASWMSVAWYPIYHIPTRAFSQEVSARFLTYHTLSAAFQDDITRGSETCSSQSGRSEKNDCISLSSFGLATQRLHRSRLWNNPEAGDHAKLKILYYAADSWLKQLSFRHHDFNYFTNW